MKKLKNKLVVVIPLLILIACVFNAETVSNSAKNALQLCIEVIIPTIFPFLFITMIISNSIPYAISPMKYFCSIVGIPESAQHILISAVLGGYPVGAQSIATAMKNGSIDQDTAVRLLGFCNNAGPSFIFGLLGTLFTNKFAPAALWLIHIASAMLIGVILPHRNTSASKSHCTVQSSISEILKRALLTTAIICGWIILFRIIITFFIVCKLPAAWKVFICGILELSNGCLMLTEINNEYTRFILASVLLSAGGMCVLLQTKSIVGEISLHTYFVGKALQTVLSILLCFIIAPLLYSAEFNFGSMTVVLLFIFSLSVILLKKSSSKLKINRV